MDDKIDIPFIPSFWSSDVAVQMEDTLKLMAEKIHRLEKEVDDLKKNTRRD